MKLGIECAREDDGRWIAEVPQLPGVLAYGNSSDEALAKAEVLALRVLAERLEHGEARPVDISITLAIARAGSFAPKLAAFFPLSSVSAGSSSARPR